MVILSREMAGHLMWAGLLVNIVTCSFFMVREREGELGHCEMIVSVNTMLNLFSVIRLSLSQAQPQSLSGSSVHFSRYSHYRLFCVHHLTQLRENYNLTFSPTVAAAVCTRQRQHLTQNKLMSLPRTMSRVELCSD